MKLVFSFTLILITFFAKGQQTAKLFEPNKISNDGVFGLTISPDSKTALWVFSGGKRDTLRIMESRKINGVWSSPKVASFSTTTGKWKDIDPIFSPNGKMVLFQSNRNTGREFDRTDFDIWAVKKTKSGWSEPYRVEGNINTEASESYASITKDGTIYFMKENENKTNSSDIYYSTLKNGKYQKPINIGLPINTNERESNPFIAPNGKYIIYFSTDKKGYGEVDLYISFKENNRWTTPKNLGSQINTSVAEFCPFFHKKEGRLYFSRQEKKEGRFVENIYYIDFNINSYK